MESAAVRVGSTSLPRGKDVAALVKYKSQGASSLVGKDFRHFEVVTAL